MLRTFFFLSSVPPLQVSRKRTKCFFLVLVYGRPYMLGNVVVVSRTLTKKKSWVNLFVAAGLFVGRRVIAENQKVINTLEKKKTVVVVVVVATMKAEKEIKVMEVSLAISAMFGIRNWGPVRRRKKTLDCRSLPIITPPKFITAPITLL